MSRENEQLYHRRCFLNDESGAAMIEAQLDNNSWTDKDTGERHPCYDGTIHITDCSRSIELSVEISNDLDKVRSNICKLDRLLDALQGMREAMVRAAKREFPGKKF